MGEEDKNARLIAETDRRYFSYMTPAMKNEKYKYERCNHGICSVEESNINNIDHFKQNLEQHQVNGYYAKSFQRNIPYVPSLTQSNHFNNCLDDNDNQYNNTNHQMDVEIGERQVRFNNINVS